MNETINIAVDISFENKPNIRISRNDLKELFMWATAKTLFLFDGEFYDQTDGVAMGSPLAHFHGFS